MLSVEIPTFVELFGGLMAFRIHVQKTVPVKAGAKEEFSLRKER